MEVVGRKEEKVKKYTHTHKTNENAIGTADTHYL